MEPRASGPSGGQRAARRGLCHYANYLEFFERAGTEWLRACGIEQRRLRDEQRVLFVVTEASLRCHAPARLDDLLRVTMRLAGIGRASLRLAQEVWRDDSRLADGDVRIACIDADSLQARRLPPAILERLRRIG